MSFDQVNEFLKLLHDVSLQQRQSPELKHQTERKIHCYVPTQSDRDSSLTFEFKSLDDWGQHSDNHDNDAIKSIAMDAQVLSPLKTCRTTTLSIAERILKFKTAVSKYFFIKPDYHTTLKFGQPEKQTFYILPPPPNVFLEHVTKAQNNVLIQLYKRLREIPKSHPEDAATRVKFDKLKTIYTQLAGEQNLDANTLLERIVAHETQNQSDLFSKRAPNFFSRLFSLSSSTERLFQHLKTDLAHTEVNPSR